MRQKRLVDLLIEHYDELARIPMTTAGLALRCVGSARRALRPVLAPQSVGAAALVYHERP